MAYVDVDEGVRLYVQDLGSGPPVVLVAGFGLDHRVWDRQVRVLATKHRVICVDQRGHGLSDKPLKGYSIDRMTHDLLRVAEELDIVQATLVGWSLGGQIAFHATSLDHGRHFSRLALVGSNGVRASRSEDFPFGAPPEALLESLVAAEYADRLSARRSTIISGFADTPPTEMVEWLVSLSLALPSWAAGPLYETMLTTDLISDIDTIGIPVLQLIGDKDPVHSARGAAWLSQRLARTSLVKLPDCGHYPMFEASDAFDAALTAFIEGEAGRA